MGDGAPSTALARVETVRRPADLDDAVEVAIASPASRVFPTRQVSSLGVCLKLGPAHAVTADGRGLVYPADSVCVRPPGCVWSSADTGPAGFIAIDVAATALPAELRRGPMRFIGADALPDLRAVVRLLLSAATRLEKDQAIAAVVGAIAAHELVDWPELAERARPAALAQARAFLEDTVDGNPTLDDVAVAARLNKHVLVRRFREHFGTTPHAYLLITKVDRARELLARGVPAAEVAVRLGFADQPHLTRVFRDAVGLTPAAYQRRVRAVG